MQDSNKIFTLPNRNQFLGWIIAKITSVLYMTLRWKQEGLIYDSKHWSEGEPTILAFWHGQQIFMPYVYKSKNRTKQRKPLFALASAHRDGQLAGATIKNLGISNIAGSSTRGGSNAFRKMIKIIEAGNHVIITPDGPRGPANIAKHGIIKLASMTGARIIPVALNAKWKWRLGSWDGIFIPKPFSHTLLLAGEPYFVKSDMDRESLIKGSQELTEKLKNLNIMVNFKLGINE